MNKSIPTAIGLYILNEGETDLPEEFEYFRTVENLTSLWDHVHRQLSQGKPLTQVESIAFAFLMEIISSGREEMKILTAIKERKRLDNAAKVQTLKDHLDVASLSLMKGTPDWFSNSDADRVLKRKKRKLKEAKEGK